MAIRCVRNEFLTAPSDKAHYEAENELAQILNMHYPVDQELLKSVTNPVKQRLLSSVVAGAMIYAYGTTNRIARTLDIGTVTIKR